jgi:hypothetical protein
MVRQRFDQSLIIRQVEDYLHEVVDARARQPGRCWSKRFGTAQRDRQISRRETGTTPRGSRQ